MKDLRMPWWQILRACWRLPLPPTQKVVLAAVASHVNDDGTAKLLVSTLVDLTGLGRSTVQTALHQLELRHPPVLERLKRSGRSSLYQINVAALPQLDLFAEAKRAAAYPVKTRPAAGPVQQPGHPAAGRGSPAARHGGPAAGPITLLEPSTNLRGSKGPRGAGECVPEGLRVANIKGLIKMLGRPASLQQQPGESLEAWEARVRAAWSENNDKPRRAAGERA